MRSLMGFVFVGVFTFVLATSSNAITFKVFDSKTGDPVAGAEVSLNYFTRIYKGESRAISALTDTHGMALITLPQATSVIDTPNNIRYAVGKADWSLGVMRGQLAMGEDTILVRLDRDPFASETPHRNLPTLWRERKL